MPSENHSERPINPKILKGLQERSRKTAGSPLVHPYNYQYATLSQVTKLPAWKKLNAYEKVESTILTEEKKIEDIERFYSLKFRYFVAAIQRLQAGDKNRVLRAVTVKLDDTTSRALAKSPKGPAALYGQDLQRSFERALKLNNRQNRLKSKPHFVFVMEESKARLHLHMLMGYDQRDHAMVERILSKGKEPIKGLQFKDSYRRRFATTPEKRWMHELDVEQGLSTYNNSAVDLKGKPYIYTNTTPDAGFLEYSLKHFEEPSKLLGQFQRYYCPNYVNEEARRIYEQAGNAHLNEDSVDCDDDQPGFPKVRRQ